MGIQTSKEAKARKNQVEAAAVESHLRNFADRCLVKHPEAHAPVLSLAAAFHEYLCLQEAPANLLKFAELQHLGRALPAVLPDARWVSMCCGLPWTCVLPGYYLKWPCPVG